MGIVGLSSVVVFLFLIDHAARLLRPVSIVGRIAQQGLKGMLGTCLIDFIQKILNIVVTPSLYILTNLRREGCDIDV
jgi:hypothetical protein